MSIWSPKIANRHQACCKIPYKGYEISIAMDDDNGWLPALSHSDIRVFRQSDHEDITREFYDGGHIIADAHSLIIIFKLIDQMVQP